MVLKSPHSCALLTFGIGTNMLSLKSSGMYPDLYILLISLVIICIPFSPMHCSNSAEMLSLPQAFPFGRSLITASISSLHHHHHHHFVYRLLLTIVHTKARVRRYQQLNPSSISYPVHLPSLVRTRPCHPSHTSSMSSYSPPSPHHPPPPNVGTQKPNHWPVYVPHAQTISACHD